MKQAIEEGFILNVLGSFTPYSTFYKINKTIEDDPEYKTNAAKRKIVRFAILHDENIVQRTAVMVEHFRNVVLKEQPWAKAMVVTGSRVEAVKYLNAFRKYVKEHGYQNANALVAFSGKLSNKEIGMLGGDVTEASLNGFSDKLTQKTFDKDGFQFIIVANKYQTGFDQPKLSAMYVLKKMSGIATVQTLSRLNRICPPFDKKTFILDFVNNIEDIIEDFKPYYTTTILSNIVTQELIYSLDARVDEFNLFDLEVVTACNQLFFDKNIKPTKREEKINAYLMQVKVDFDARDEKEQREILLTLRKFVQYYEFFVQATSYEDINLHMKYYFITWLLPYLKIGSSGAGVNLKGKIEATDFYQKKGDEISHPIFVPDPAISLPSVEELGLSDDEEKRLSEIIVEINNKTGMSFDNDVAVKAALQIRDILRKNKDLIVSAKENPLSDFAFPFYRNIDQALQEGWNQNQEFYSLLLNNEVFKKEILGLFMNGIYNDLKRKE